MTTRSSQNVTYRPKMSTPALKSKTAARSAVRPSVAAPTGVSQVRVAPGVLTEFRDRRRRRRVDVPGMYTQAVMRVLSQQAEPMEGHVVNLSETGIAVEVDFKVAVGQPVTLEFSVSGLGRMNGENWPTFAVAAEVVRHDNLEDFPQGPYRTALKFVRIPTMVQAQFARYVASHPEPALH